MAQQKKEPFTFQLQFLIAHEQEYNKNASILKTCDANPKTRYEIESMKSFILSYCLILLGSDLDWMGASKAGDGGCPVDPPVLAPANADDDDPESPEKAAAELGQQPAPACGANDMLQRASDADSDETPIFQKRMPVTGIPGSALPKIPVDNFLLWSPDQFGTFTVTKFDVVTKCGT